MHHLSVRLAVLLTAVLSGVPSGALAQEEQTLLRYVPQQTTAVVWMPRPAETFRRYRALIPVSRPRSDEQAERIADIERNLDLIEQTLEQFRFVVFYVSSPNESQHWAGYGELLDDVNDPSSFELFPEGLKEWLLSLNQARPIEFDAATAAADDERDEDQDSADSRSEAESEIYWELRDQEVFFSSDEASLERLVAVSSGATSKRLIDDRDFQIAIRNLSQANDYDLLLYVPLVPYRELFTRSLWMTMITMSYWEISEESFTKCIDCVRSVTASISLSEANEREDCPILESELFVQLTEPNPPLLEGLIRGRPVTLPSLPNDVGALQIYGQASVDGPKFIEAHHDSIKFELVEIYSGMPRAEAIEALMHDTGRSYWSDEVANHWDGSSVSVFGETPDISYVVSHRFREPESLGPELVELLSETFNGPYLAHDFDFETHSQNDVITVVPTNESLNRFMTGPYELDYQKVDEEAISSMKRWFTEQNGQDSNDDEFRVWLAEYRKLSQKVRDQVQRELARGVSIHGEWLLQWEKQQSAETDGSRIREQFEQLDERLRKELKGRSEQEYPRLLASWWDSPFKLLPPSLLPQPPADSITDDDPASPTEDRSAPPIAEQPGLDLLLYGHRVERGVSLRLSAYK